MSQAVDGANKVQGPPSGLVAQPISPLVGVPISLPPEQADKPTASATAVAFDISEAASDTDMDFPLNDSDLDDPPRRLVGLTAQDFLMSQSEDDETASEMEDYDGSDDDEDDSEDEWASDPADTFEALDGGPWSSVPIVFPRRVFTGARNIDTVKDGQ